MARDGNHDGMTDHAQPGDGPGPSARATKAAIYEASAGGYRAIDRDAVRDGIVAAHDPALYLDRSVSARFVYDWLHERQPNGRLAFAFDEWLRAQRAEAPERSITKEIT